MCCWPRPTSYFNYSFSLKITGQRDADNEVQITNSSSINVCICAFLLNQTNCCFPASLQHFFLQTTQKQSGEWSRQHQRKEHNYRMACPEPFKISGWVMVSRKQEKEPLPKVITMIMVMVMIFIYILPFCFISSVRLWKVHNMKPKKKNIIKIKAKVKINIIKIKIKGWFLKIGIKDFCLCFVTF